MPKPNHTYWFKKVEIDLKTIDGKSVNIVNFQYPQNYVEISNLASYIRNLYCKDEELDELRRATGLSRKEYLKQIKIPERGMIKSSDFSEILVADYIEYVLNYIVPRTKYDNKINKDTSPGGIDVIGFKITDISQIYKDDILITCEVKAALREKNVDILKESIKDSKKDLYIRKAESLNAIKQRCKDRREIDMVKIVERFQNITDNPYTEVTGATAVNSMEIWDDRIVIESTCEEHPNKNNIFLLIIRGNDFMDLVNNLYERICNEA